MSETSPIPEAVEAHYTVNELESAIVAALEKMGKSTSALSPEDLAPIDEFHSRGREATAELAALVSPSAEAQVLDVGSGLGGTARYLAHQHGCRVTGLDLTEAYCVVASRLSAWVGLSDRTTFRHGNALHMPFDDNSFDIVWTEHAQMNVADKRGFYAEIARVLRRGGRLAFHDIFAGGGGPVHFPVPWASVAALSALAPAADVRRLLADLGFGELVWEDRSALSLAWFRQALQRAQAQGRSPLGLHLLMGDNTSEKVQNLARNLDEGRVVVVMGVLERA